MDGLQKMIKAKAGAGLRGRSPAVAHAAVVDARARPAERAIAAVTRAAFAAGAQLRNLRSSQTASSPPGIETISVPSGPTIFQASKSALAGASIRLPSSNRTRRRPPLSAMPSVTCMCRKGSTGASCDPSPPGSSLFSVPPESAYSNTSPILMLMSLASSRLTSAKSRVSLVTCWPTTGRIHPSAVSRIAEPSWNRVNWQLRERIWIFFRVVCVRIRAWPPGVVHRLAVLIVHPGIPVRVLRGWLHYPYHILIAITGSHWLWIDDPLCESNHRTQAAPHHALHLRWSNLRSLHPPAT